MFPNTKAIVNITNIETILIMTVPSCACSLDKFLYIDKFFVKIITEFNYFNQLKFILNIK
jgi:hypothetical protein